MSKNMTKNSIVGEVGQFPTLNEKYRGNFPTGRILLKYGEHRGPNRGFGVQHILAEHTSDLTKHNLEHSTSGVIAYIQLILRTGAKIYSEFAAVRGYHRPTIIWSPIGTVILERQEINGETVYSVITAFGRKNAVGMQIGTL